LTLESNLCHRHEPKMTIANIESCEAAPSGRDHSRIC
jgi:hypothetical protein